MEIAVSPIRNHVPDTRGEPSTPRIMGNDVMSKALQQISFSLFSEEIENSYLPSRFVRPTFVMYDGKSNPIDHVKHYN